MKASIKFILLFVLLALVFSVGGKTVDVKECSEQDDSHCQLSSFESGKKQVFDSLDTTDLDKFQGLTISDMEQGFKPVSETNSSTNNLRLRRIAEASEMLAVMRKFSLLRENLLVLGQSKFFSSDKDPHYALISCDYYIIALRRILI